MHILMIAPAIADYCVEFANALSSAARVTLIAPRRTFEEHAPFVDQKVDLQLVDWPRHRSLANIMFMRWLRRKIDSLRPDVIHILSEGVIWLNMVLPTARKYGIVTTVHDVTYHPGDQASRRVPRWFADQLISQSDRVIVHGSALLEAAEHKYPHIKAKLAVLPHIALNRYLDMAAAEGLHRQESDKVRVLYFGRIYPYKGLDFLIRSVPLVTKRFSGVRIVIAGEGDTFSAYRKLIVEPEYFDIRNRRIPDTETAQLFLDSDIVVLPYVEASQSGVLSVAQAFAKPVIVTDVGELGRAVTDGVSGLVVPPGDAKALAEAILKLATNDALRTQLGIAGRDEAERTTSPAAISKGAMEIYESVIAARKR